MEDLIILIAFIIFIIFLGWAMKLGVNYGGFRKRRRKKQCINLKKR